MGLVGEGETTHVFDWTGITAHVIGQEEFANACGGSRCYVEMVQNVSFWIQSEYLTVSAACQGGERSGVTQRLRRGPQRTGVQLMGLGVAGNESIGSRKEAKYFVCRHQAISVLFQLLVREVEW